MLTKQEVLEKLIATSAAGGFPSMGRTRGCSYLADDGKKCGVGLFIPDGHEAQKSGYYVRKLFLDFPDLRERLCGEVPLLDWEKIQSAHDGMALSGEGWDHGTFEEKVRAILA